jgi:hypothetical protein
MEKASWSELEFDPKSSSNTTILYLSFSKVSFPVFSISPGAFY